MSGDEFLRYCRPVDALEMHLATLDMSYPMCGRPDIFDRMILTVYRPGQTAEIVKPLCPQCRAAAAERSIAGTQSARLPTPSR